MAAVVNARKQAVIDAGIFPAVIRDVFPALQATGKDQVLVCCPFHQEENPSLSVNLSAGLFNCFACGVTGNGFDLYMQVQGCDFKTALHELEARAGITAGTRAATGRPSTPLIDTTHRFTATTSEPGVVLSFCEEHMPEDKRASVASGVLEVKEVLKGKGVLHALCPVCGDRNKPTFSYSYKKDHCNCSVCGFKGDLIDLWCHQNGLKRDTDGFIAFSQKFNFDNPPDSISPSTKTTIKTPTAIAPKVKPKVVATFYYLDAEGKRQYWKKRFEPGFDGKRKKSFAAYHKDKSGKEAKGRGCDPLLYNTHKLATNPPGEPVFFLEGERKADVLSAWGLCATSLDSGGQSGKTKTTWRDEFHRFFEGREVYILPDNDAAGEIYATTVAGRLAGVAAAVRILRLPGLPEKGDICDWCKLQEGAA